MSGGHWNYQDTEISEVVDPRRIPYIMNSLRQAFHEVDWAESGDTNKQAAAARLYEIIRDLGDRLFGEAT